MSPLKISQNTWPTFFQVSHLFFLICAQENKHTAHMCGGIKMLKHNVTTTLRLACHASKNHTHKQNTSKWNAPKWLQLLGSRFTCLLLFQTAENRTQRNRCVKRCGVCTRTVARKSLIGGFTFTQGDWHSENLVKSPLIYSVTYLNLEGLNPPTLPVATGLVKLPQCCHYWNTYKKLKPSNQVWLNSTANNWKVFFLTFFITKSSRNSLRFICLSLSLLMHRMLIVGNLSWNTAALQFIFNYLESWDFSPEQWVTIKLTSKGPRGWINQNPLI